jgi:cellulose biosynthesis protein BcsQ
VIQTISFFNHKGGVGKTTMLFNLAVEMGRLDYKVLMVDLDAQANLTAISLDDGQLARLYPPPPQVSQATVAGAFAPLVSGAGDVATPPAVEVRTGRVWLLPGDIQLTTFESILPNAWTESLAGNERGFRVTSAPYRLIQDSAEQLDADYVFVDLGPNVGALNRAVLLGSDFLILPMASDMFSLRALPSVGQSLDTWIRQWKTAQSVAPPLAFDVPRGLPKTLGFVSQQFNIYRGEATMAFSNWIDQMPGAVQDGLLDLMARHGDGYGGTLAQPASDAGAKVGDLKNFHSLVPHAQSLRLAIFELTADEVVRGGQLTRVRESEAQFRDLCEEIVQRTWSDD